MDRSWRTQFWIGVGAGLVGLICLAISVPNGIPVLGGIAGFVLLGAAVLLIAALWGYLARNKA